MGVTSRRLLRVLAPLALALAIASELPHAAVATSWVPRAAAARFRTANELARHADYPRAIAIYDSLAAAGFESASL